MAGCANFRRILLFSASFIVVGLTTDSVAFELNVEASALEKLLKTRVFQDEGRYYLAKRDDCYYPYLEYPTVVLRSGRVHVQAHFSGRLGTRTPFGCIGAADPSWLTISGKPYFREGNLGLESLKLEQIEKKRLKPLVEVLLSKAGEGLRFNLRDVIRGIVLPSKIAPYEINLVLLTVSRIVVDEKKVVLEVELKLSAR